MKEVYATMTGIASEVATTFEAVAYRKNVGTQRPRRLSTHLSHSAYGILPAVSTRGTQSDSSEGTQGPRNYRDY